MGPAPFHTRSIIAALLVTVVGAACSSATGEAASLGPQPAISTGRPYVAADVHFMSMMVGHHAQAIEMSRLAPTRAASNSVRILAERIINTQQDEIATLQQWLRDRGQPVPETHAMGAHAGHGAGHGAGHQMPMHGMLSKAQMKQLEQAKGAEFDRLFLTYMIQHHRGGVVMVTELFGSTGAAQNETVFKMASDINVDQTTEIARMQKMLADLVFGSGSP
ncbi:DUF305 domain-containing protein [soil metagenome]